MTTPNKIITVEIIYALPHNQVLKKINIFEGATVEQAIKTSGILLEFPEIDLTTYKFGIFSKFAERNTMLRSSDRVEIYRPLIIDPKDARRIRAKNKSKSNR
ncbi:MAG: RnfH family protein [Nitrosomonas sp.]|nr:RnfH family protein [Nitrosomonas sp.]